MGTNYYLIENHPCKECGHQRENLHIGKSSIGWQFHFQGYPELGIVSYKDWVEKILENSGHIENEDGNIVAEGDFFLLVEHKQENKDNINHYDYCSKKYGGWKDAEGYSFSSTDFS